MILSELAAHARKRVEAAKQEKPLEAIRAQALALPKGDFRFEKALRQPRAALICEVKKASPSKGVIDAEFDYLAIARDYQAGGADCISCLTEPKWFLGSDEIFADIRKAVTLPMLRKDFTVDEYQLYESTLLGADAVLLICALLDTRTIARYLGICEALGISALVETHDAAEIGSAVRAGARLIGVNNRNLKDFSVDFSNAESLRRLVPETAVFVAESGVQSPADVAALRQAGAGAVLVGEALMRAENRQEMLQQFLEAAQ
ncbi:MAG TPA: indole-3-glycerol phosphate synthase TrpC [Candidatus Limiplasma sp.]|mgnify:CR=1 FL=1|nr:indole-3-glycerol phosphate synthase TrpC [Candidatus Limiplasma sp.]HRX08111.1 indole-3-glycerol phosphate synthase TrpC [Candidatus Limiplasma sp.]